MRTLTPALTREWLPSRHVDYAGVLLQESSNPVQCAVVMDTSQRSWLRLVGRRHDVQSWRKDTRAVGHTCKRVYPKKLKDSEKWCAAAPPACLLLLRACAPRASLADPLWPCRAPVGALPRRCSATCLPQGAGGA